jgi:glutamyl-tRNA(Gln) amidotransferase subunit E
MSSVVVWMDDAFFESLGFMCGMEVHQQLKTQRKLFCRCPPVYRNDPAHFTIIRHMRPTLSEMGTYDGTALMEFKTRKNITYEFYRDTCCSYEIDDTPPFELDELALEISLVIASALNSHLVDEVHVSRKQYLDGTIPTGFQRTAIVSLKGKIPWKADRELLIRQISLEEDACREVRDVGHEVTFRTDRLSIPLVEVVTEPVAKNPTEAREISERIGRVMRSTGLVRRGPGSTRQDVNVSVRGGRRVEIKGVPFLDLIPTITAGEAIRQWNLLKIRDELEGRGLKVSDMDADKFTTMVAKDVTHLLEGKRIPVMSHLWPNKVEAGKGYRIMAVLLKGWAGIFPRETHYSQRFIDEISGRVRVIACLDHLPNVLSSDTDAPKGITKKAYAQIMKELGGTKADAFVLVFGDERDTKTASEEVYIRCRDAFEGVPNETRQVMTPHETSFERILPGPDRMYPDTDRPPIVVTPEILRRVHAQVPKPFWEAESEMVSKGVKPHLARQLVISPLYPTYKDAVAAGSLPGTVAGILMETVKSLRRKDVPVQNISASQYADFFSALRDGSLTRDGIAPMLRSLAEGLTVLEALEKLGLRSMSDHEARSLIGKIISADPALAAEFKAGREGPLMGAILSSSSGRIGGARARSILAGMP